MMSFMKQIRDPVISCQNRTHIQPDVMRAKWQLTIHWYLFEEVDRDLFDAGRQFRSSIEDWLLVLQDELAYVLWKIPVKLCGIVSSAADTSTTSGVSVLEPLIGFSLMGNYSNHEGRFPRSPSGDVCALPKISSFPGRSMKGNTSFSVWHVY